MLVVGINYVSRELDENIIQLIREYGQYEEKRECWRLPAGDLRDLTFDVNQQIAVLANALNRIIRKNPPKLLLDEQKMCRQLGINTGHHFCYVRYYKRSGRVSAHWEAHTRSQKDVTKWWNIAPPNHKEKYDRLRIHHEEK